MNIENEYIKMKKADFLFTLKSVENHFDYLKEKATSAIKSVKSGVSTEQEKEFLDLVSDMEIFFPLLNDHFGLETVTDTSRH